MSTHHIAQGMSQIDKSRETLGEKIESAYSDLMGAIANGDRKVQETASAALHGHAHTALSLSHAASSLLPAITADKGEAQSVEDATAKGRKRT